MTGANLKQSALSGARWTLAAKVGMQLITWPITILVIRLLEPGDYGLLAMAMVTIGFISLFSELGFGAALVQASSLDDSTARTASAAIVGCNLAMAAGLYMLAPLAASWFSEPDVVAVMRVLTLELLISSLAAVPQAQLERQLRFRDLSIASISGGVIGALTTLVLALLELGVWALVGGNLAMASVRSVTLICFNGRPVWPSLRHGFAPLNGLVRFSIQVLAARVLWYWHGQADQLILAKMLHASLLGSYNVAAQLAMLPASKAMEVINRVAFPILSRMSDERERLQATHARLLALVATYAFGVCWALAAVAPELVGTLLGEKWHAAALPLTLLAAVTPLRMLSALNNTVTSAAGVPKASTIELAFAGLVLPTTIFIGALFGGLHGASLAWLVTYPIVYLASNALTCKALRKSTMRGLSPLAAPLAAGSLMWSCIAGVRWQLDGGLQPVVLLALELLAGTAGYVVAICILAPAVARDVRDLTSDLLHPKRAGEPAPVPRQAQLPS